MIAEALAGMFAATTIDPRHPGDPVLARMFGFGSKTEAGVVVDGKSVMGCPAFWRAVNIIGNGVAKPPLNIYERIDERDKRKAIEHPAYRLLAKRAHANCGAGTFRKLLQSHAMIWGNGFAYIERNEGGEPVALYPLPPDKTVLARVEGGQYRTDLNSAGDLLYSTQLAGESYSVAPENMLHVHGLGYNEFWGYSVIDLLREAIGVGLAAQRYVAKFYGNGATPSALIMAPPSMSTPEKLSTFTDGIRNRIEGLSKSHRALVLAAGTEYKQTSISPEDSQLLQTREFEDRVIAQVTGVQPHKLGDSSRKSYASLEQSNQEHLDDDLDPWLGIWEEECEEKLLTATQKLADSHFVEFNRKALMRTNLAARTAHYSAGRQWGYYSANDVRRAENEPPIGESGDIYLTPGNMIPADQASALTQVGTTPAPPVEEDEEEQEEEDRGDDKARAAVAELTRHELNRLGKRVANAATASAKKGGKDFCEFLDRMRGWGHEPACIAPVLGAAIERAHAALSKYTEPPYRASDLAANITEAADGVVGLITKPTGGDDA